MAQPSSTHRESRADRGDRDREDRHRERERERERERRSSRSHHHHRTISSTTLPLVLSLVLAVLAVMLSLPSSGLPPIGGAPADPNEPPKPGVWGILTPKRSQELVRREGEVARREADVARREAELLAGAPGGVLTQQSAPPPPIPTMACPICPTFPPAPVMQYEPVQTVIKEVFKESTEVTPPGWYAEGQMRFQDILDRELKIADREREISRREETVNRREHDAARREAWIMEQLMFVQPPVHICVYMLTWRPCTVH